MNARSMTKDRCDPMSDFELILEQQGPFLQQEARRALHGIVPRDVLDLEIDEVVQRVRINLWLIAERGIIQKPKAYIRRMVHNEMLQLLRSRRPTTPLPLDNDGELFQGKPLSIGTLAEDPAEQVEQIDVAAHSLEWMLNAIDQLPTRQRSAMLMSLKERVDNFSALQKACDVRKIELESFNWPHQDQEATLRLRSSLSIARRKLSGMLESSL